jgi:hypothetical protein
MRYKVGDILTTRLLKQDIKFEIKSIYSKEIFFEDIESNKGMDLSSGYFRDLDLMDYY